VTILARRKLTCVRIRSNLERISDAYLRVQPSRQGNKGQEHDGITSTDDLSILPASCLRCCPEQTTRWTACPAGRGTISSGSACDQKLASRVYRLVKHRQILDE
jgi:hypothetical protein